MKERARSGAAWIVRGKFPLSFCRPSFQLATNGTYLRRLVSTNGIFFHAIMNWSSKEDRGSERHPSVRPPKQFFQSAGFARISARSPENHPSLSPGKMTSGLKIVFPSLHPIFVILRNGFRCIKTGEYCDTSVLSRRKGTCAFRLSRER